MDQRKYLPTKEYEQHCDWGIHRSLWERYDPLKQKHCMRQCALEPSQTWLQEQSMETHPTECLTELSMTSEYQELHLKQPILLLLQIPSDILTDYTDGEESRRLQKSENIGKTT